jgi:predicted enzyme related to lactoylglutathione lyase
MAHARPIVHFEIHGKDAKRLQDLYAKLFDWQIDTNNPINYGLVSPGVGGPEEGVGGGITTSPTAPFVTVYVQVVSLDDTLKQVQEMGGKTVMPAMDVPGGPTIALFADPEGNVVGPVKQ